MKIATHLTKIEHFESSISKLDLEEDYEILVEAYMLAAAHYINAVLHKSGKVKENKDIKHNQMFSFLKTDKEFDEIANTMKSLDDLRPSHVYGKGKNGNTGRSAKEAYLKIKDSCQSYLEDEEQI